MMQINDEVTLDKHRNSDMVSLMDFALKHFIGHNKRILSLCSSTQFSLEFRKLKQKDMN